MNHNPQELYNQILELKVKIKNLKKVMTERYEELPEYVELGEKIKELRDRRKQLALSVDAKHPAEVNQLNDLKIDLNSTKEMFNDLMLTKLTKGEVVEIKNKFSQPMLPMFNVTLRAE